MSDIFLGLNDADRFRRYGAVLAMQHRKDIFRDHVLELRNDPYANIRVEVIRAIVDLDIQGEDAVSIIAQYLDDDDSLVRAYAEWVRGNRSGLNPKSEKWLLEDRLGWWGPKWNLSRDDPWWSDWLTSTELFATFQRIVRQHGRVVQPLLDGTLFDFDNECHVQVWITPNEIVAGYASSTDLSPVSSALTEEFQTAISHLRHSPPMELGLTRDGFSYGAILSCGHPAAEVKWAAAGDWAAMVRNWHVG